MTADVDHYLDLLKKCLSASIYPESAWYILGGEGYRNTQVRRERWTFRRFARGVVVRFLAKRSLLLVKQLPYNPNARELGLDWPCFGYTMIGLRRLDNLQFCIEDVLRRNVPGDLIETGVWRGGSVIFMRAVLKRHEVKDRLVWAADSFEGMPVPDGDTYPDDKGADLSDFALLKAPLEQVRASFARFGLLDDQVRFLKGWFRDTLPEAPIERLAILRLDGDLYESTMDALRVLYPRVSPGGYVIVDDYNWPTCRKAVTDYRLAHGIVDEIKEIDGAAIYWQVTDIAERGKLPRYDTERHDVPLQPTNS
jgi:hypothetical protein